MTYERLKDFDKRKTDSDLINLVRSVLYNFSYKDLDKEYKGEDVTIIRKSIINYLYVGKFTLEKDQDLCSNAICLIQNIIIKNYDNLISNLNKKFAEEKEENKKEIKEEINKIRKIKNSAKRKFDFEKHFYNSYLKNWCEININHNKYIKEIDIVNFLLVYEAPPFSNDTTDYLSKYYFLTSNKGNYASTIKTCFNKKKTDVKKVLVDNNIAYFDLIMGGLPIADDKNKATNSLRFKWCYNDDWKIGGKSLPIVLLELGICYLLTNLGRKIIKFPKIAIGAPVKTSITIFEYYSTGSMKVFIEKEQLTEYLINPNISISDFIFPNPSEKSVIANVVEILSVDIARTNSNLDYKKLENGILLPLHKSNIVSSANSPNAQLLKNAFDNY